MTTWPVRPLGEVASSQLGKMLDAAKNKGTALPYLRNINVRWDAFSLDDLQEMRFESDELERFTVRAGDLVVCEGGEPGRCAVWTESTKTIQYQKALHRIRPGPEVEARWLYYQLRFLAESARLREYFTGTTIKHLTGDALRRVPIQVPPRDVQRRIVAKLDELLAQSRAARAQLEAVPDLVEKYRQSVLAAAFRGDLTADWRKKNSNVEPASKLLERIRIERRKAWETAELTKMKAKDKTPKDDKWKTRYEEPASVAASGLRELPSTWCWASLDEVAHIQQGFGFPPAIQGRRSGDVPFLKVGDISRAFKGGATEFGDADNWVSNADLDALGAAPLPKGAVVFAKIGAAIALNRRVMLSRAALIDNNAMGLWPAVSLVSQDWLFRFMLTVRLNELAQATTVPSVRKSDVQRIAIAVAPLAEQRLAAQRLSDALAILSDQGRQLADAAAMTTGLDRALLAKAFTGALER